MIHVIATVELRPGTLEPFLAEFARVVPAVRAEQGCLQYSAAVDMLTDLAAQGPARPDVVTIVEQWTNLAALKQHLAAPHMAEYRESVKDYVRSVSLQVLRPAGEPI